MIELLSKDKNEKFQFAGRCKLSINSVSKMLLVEPFNEEYKMISAMFKWQFVSQKNILFVFAEHDFQDFAIIFDDTKKCNKAYDFLIKKEATSGIKELIHERFLPALFKHISENNEPKMKERILNWIKQQDGKEKEEYIQLLKNYNISDMIVLDKEKRTDQKNYRTRKAKDISGSKQNSSKTNDSDSKKRRAFKRQRLVDCPTKIIEPSNFKVLKHFHRGALKTTLSIFTSPDRKYCYEYFWDKSKRYFLCYACCSRKVRMSARIIKRKGKNAVMLKGTQHVCKERIYKRIIEKPNFEVMSYHFRKTIIQRLIIFSDSSQSTCYEYLWSKDAKLWHCTGCLKATPKRWTAAEICQKEDGTDFVMLKPCEGHVCEMISFNREKYIGKQIVEAAKFKIFKNVHDGINRSKLVIFTSSEKTTCYEYSWQNSDKKFRCCGCMKQKKSITAEVFQHPDGSDYLKLNKNKHVCDPCEYNSQKYETSDEIIESSNFKVFEYKHNGAMTERLVLFCSTNKNLCYEYFKNPIHNIYMCGRCPVGKRVTALLCQNNGAKEYVKLSKESHVCDLQEFDPEKYKDDIIIEKSMYEITAIATRGNAVQRMLTIFADEEKKYYYKFIYNKASKYFYCSKCHIMKMNLTATIQNEGKENEYVFMSNQKHVCEPLEYLEITSGNIVKAPNYQIVKRRTRGKMQQHLIVFTNDERSECYEYSWSEAPKSFVCRPCGMHHKYFIYAKIIKNKKNEECVQLSEKPHKCNPIKFIPEDINTKIVVQPNYQLLNRKYHGKIYQHLVVFTNDEKDECYDYTWSEAGKVFRCQPCVGRYKMSVYAKIFHNDENEECVELCKTEHKCTPIEFIPEQLTGKIVKQPGFKLWEDFFRNKKSKRLTIFDLKNKNYGYTYTFATDRKYYVCHRCRGVKPTAKLLQDENGENYLELNNAEHVCKMQKL